MIKTIATAGFLALCVGLAGGAWLTGKHYNAEIATMKAEQAQQQAAVAAKVQELQAQHNAKMKEVLNEANEQAAEIQRNHDSLLDANDRLRKAAASFSATAKAGAACTSQSQPSADPIGLLIGLLEGMADRGGEVSRYADQLRAAGVACEALFDK